MSIKHDGMVIGRGKPMYSGKSQHQCHLVHHKSDMDCLVIETRPAWDEAGH